MEKERNLDQYLTIVCFFFSFSYAAYDLAISLRMLLFLVTVKAWPKQYNNATKKNVLNLKVLCPPQLIFSF